MSAPPDVEVDLAATLSQPPQPERHHPFGRGVPFQFFAAPPHARRDRRPTDVILLLLTLFWLCWIAVSVDESPAGVHAAVIDVLQSLPNALTPLWQVLHDLLGVWAVLLIVLSLWRRHWALVRDLVVAVAGVWIGAALVGRLAMGSWPDLWDDLVHHTKPVSFPSLWLAATVAAVSVASPHLARPVRYAGRWFVVLGALASSVLGYTVAGHESGALALGWAVAAAVHLVFGSPGGLPSLRRVKLGLEGIAVDAEPLDVELRGGVAWLHARGSDGRELDVKVYGRDAWDGQLLVSLWRFMWYRDSGPTLSLSRLQQVEHEAFLTLLADRRGVPVTKVVAAGLAPGGVAILVTERFGHGLGGLGAMVTDAQLASAWAALDRLHAAGIRHGGLDMERIRVAGDEVRLSDFGGAQSVTSSADMLIDRAQLLVASSIAVGIDRAVAAAISASSLDELAVVASVVQPAALPISLRRAADRAEVDVDEVRKAVTVATGAPPRELQRLRRLSLGRVLLALLLVVASWALISSLADIGIDTIVDSMKGASVPLLILAFFIGMTPRVANAVAVSAAAPVPVPLGRLTALQFAISFVNLAMPSTAARVAVNIRFFERSGVDAPSSVTIGVLDSFVGFLGQLLLIGTVLLFGLGSLNLDISLDLSQEQVVRLLLLLVAVAAIAMLVVAFVAKLRAAVVGAARRAWTLTHGLLTSPRRFVTLLGANILSDLLFTLCMYTVLRAFGQNVGFGDLILVNVGVSLFAGLMPVPGGIGVAEAALTAGFIAIGVDEATAFAAAITYRVVTFYTPPVIGFVAFRWLQKQRYL